MKLRAPFLIAAGLSSLISIATPVRAAPESRSQITVLYDAFGNDPSMSKSLSGIMMFFDRAFAA